MRKLQNTTLKILLIATVGLFPHYSVFSDSAVCEFNATDSIHMYHALENQNSFYMLSKAAL